VEFNDQTLIEEIRAGSHVAFESLMKRYERAVYLTVYPYVRQPDSAMDISQEVFTRVYRGLGSYSGKGSFTAWLMTVAHNESKSWLRKHRRHQGHDEWTPENDRACAPGQEINVARRESREMLLEEMQQLNPRQRMAVSLRYFEEMSIREVADVLDCSVGVVKSILFRSLEKLRNRLTLPQRDDHDGMSRISDDNPELRSG
jgi:RNA polymerase sigma-70 factor (ECF subfamily)